MTTSSNTVVRRQLTKTVRGLESQVEKLTTRRDTAKEKVEALDAEITEVQETIGSIEQQLEDAGGPLEETRGRKPKKTTGKRKTKGKKKAAATEDSNEE